MTPAKRSPHSSERDSPGPKSRPSNRTPAGGFSSTLHFQSPPQSRHERIRSRSASSRKQTQAAIPLNCRTNAELGELARYSSNLRCQRRSPSSMEYIRDEADSAASARSDGGALLRFPWLRGPGDPVSFLLSADNQVPVRRHSARKVGTKNGASACR